MEKSKFLTGGYIFILNEGLDNLFKNIIKWNANSEAEDRACLKNKNAG